MENDKPKDNGQSYIILTKIALAIFGVICTGLSFFGLFGLAKIYAPQTKTTGKVVWIAIEYRPQSTERTYVYTFEYVADNGLVHQFEDRFTKNVYMPE